MRAEEEYRSLILQYPDSKLVPEAKQRLLEVQEVLGAREYSIGRFYYLRQSYPAAIARLNSLVERYPLYSQVDEALFLLGQAYEGEIAVVRSKPANEVAKARMIEEFTKKASDAYSKIITRYPMMDRVEDAKRRLSELHRPIPEPTAAAIAQSKAEEESRRTTGMVGRLTGSFTKHPDVAQATKIGEPTLVEPRGMSATDVVKAASAAAMGPVAGGTKSIEVEIPKDGSVPPPPNQPAPRSDSVVPDNSGAQPAAPDPNELKPNVAPDANAPPDPNELKPNVAPGSNELKAEPAADGGQALPPPAQVNEIDKSAPAAADGSSSSSSTSSNTSSSKPKKKKGLRKVVPF
jgi:outer membrane protein assembly factor BamD